LPKFEIKKMTVISGKEYALGAMRLAYDLGIRDEELVAEGVKSAIVFSPSCGGKALVNSK
jgi:ATP-dependent protease HslVU (ClpYQ) peptidase subunit